MPWSMIVRCGLWQSDSVWCSTWYTRHRSVHILLLSLVRTSNPDLHTRFSAPPKTRGHGILSGKAERKMSPTETLS